MTNQELLAEAESWISEVVISIGLTLTKFERDFIADYVMERMHDETIKRVANQILIEVVYFRRWRSKIRQLRWKTTEAEAFEFFEFDINEYQFYDKETVEKVVRKLKRRD